MPGYLSISTLLSQDLALLMVACLSVKPLLLPGFIPCLLPYLCWLDGAWRQQQVVCVCVCLYVCA